MNTINQIVDVKSSILKSIDDIDEILLESDMSITNKLLNSYIKYEIVIEYADDKDEFAHYQFIQEGEVLDEAKGQSYENIVKRIVMFIPRLVIALGKKIVKMFSKEKTDKFSKQADSLIDKLKNASPGLLHDIGNTIKAIANGEITYDHKTGSIVSVGINLAFGFAFIDEAKTILEKIANFSNPFKHEEYSAFAKEIQECLDKNNPKTFKESEAFSIGLDAAKKLALDGAVIGLALSELSKKINSKLSKSLENEDKTTDPTLHNLRESAKQLSEKVQNLSSATWKICTRLGLVVVVVDKLYSKYCTNLSEETKEQMKKDEETIDKMRAESAELKRLANASANGSDAVTEHSRRQAKETYKTNRDWRRAAINAIDQKMKEYDTVTDQSTKDKFKEELLIERSKLKDGYDLLDDIDMEVGWNPINAINAFADEQRFLDDMSKLSGKFKDITGEELIEQKETKTIRGILLAGKVGVITWASLIPGVGLGSSFVTSMGTSAAAVGAVQGVDNVKNAIANATNKGSKRQKIIRSTEGAERQQEMIDKYK